MEKHRDQLKALIQLALSDQKFSQDEKLHIYTIAIAHNFTKEDVDQLVDENLKLKGEVTMDFKSLTFDDRFEFLYNIVQLMKIDHEIYLSEIKYCESIAQILGFDIGVIKSLSSKIFSDPSITSDIEKIKKEAKKYER
jgi:uncharacterized tellurite resistance protein B-like protein